MDTMSPTDERRATHDLDAEQRQWQSWIDAVCADLGVPAALVDVAAIHDLSRQVARSGRLTRRRPWRGTRCRRWRWTWRRTGPMSCPGGSPRTSERALV